MNKYYVPNKPDKRLKDALIVWNRGENCNFVPNKDNLKEEEALEKYILKGWLPEKPFISKNNKITAFGSCFAYYVADYLGKNGYNVGFEKDKNIPYIISFGSELVNTYSIVQQFSWVWDDLEFAEPLWHTKNKEILAYEPVTKKHTKEHLDNTDIFIITIGLSEIWYNKETGEVFWRAIPNFQFDEKKHGFRIATYQENVNNLNTIVKLIKKHRPTASIIFTLSPIPLFATFRPISCITANCVSKSILRASIDEVVCSYGKQNNVFYWPSYEIVKDFLEDPFGDDPVHVKLEVVDFIMDAFKRHYLMG